MKCECAGFGLPDIFLLIGLKAQTGELVIESGNNIGSIDFHDGKILHAFSPSSRAIGDLLVERGVISDDELIEMLKFQKKDNTMPIGGLFVKIGKVSFDDIEEMVHEQIRQAAKEFMSWDKPRLSFLEKDLHPFDRIHLCVHEFLPPETLKSSNAFLSEASLSQKQASSPASTTV